MDTQWTPQKWRRPFVVHCSDGRTRCRPAPILRPAPTARTSTGTRRRPPAVGRRGAGRPRAGVDLRADRHRLGRRVALPARPTDGRRMALRHAPCREVRPSCLSHLAGRRSSRAGTAPPKTHRRHVRRARAGRTGRGRLRHVGTRQGGGSDVEPWQRAMADHIGGRAAGRWRREVERAGTEEWHLARSRPGRCSTATPSRSRGPVVGPARRRRSPADIGRRSLERRSRRGATGTVMFRNVCHFSGWGVRRVSRVLRKTHSPTVVKWPPIRPDAFSAHSHAIPIPS